MIAFSTLLCYFGKMCVLDLGLHDEAEEVRTEAAISIPVMVLWSGLDVSSPVFEIME